MSPEICFWSSRRRLYLNREFRLFLAALACYYAFVWHPTVAKRGNFWIYIFYWFVGVKFSHKILRTSCVCVSRMPKNFAQYMPVFSSLSGNDRFRCVRKQAELFYQGTHFRAFGSELCLGLLIHLQLQRASSSVCGILVFWMLFMQHQKFGSLLPECKVFSIVISLCCMLPVIILQ